MYIFNAHDFGQFLEEARQHSGKTKLVSPISQPHLGEVGKRRIGEEKHKQSWKNSLFKWCKADKKNKPAAMHMPSVKARNSHVSGPIYKSESGVDKRHRRPTSGPLTAIFNSSKRVETDIPYASLEQLNISSEDKSFGPLYLVT